MKQSVFHRRARYLDTIGQDESALELSRGDPAVQVNPLNIVGGFAAHDQLPIFQSDRQVLFREARNGKRDAEPVIAGLFDVVGWVAFVSGAGGPLHKALKLIETQKEWVRSKA